MVNCGAINIGLQVALSNANFISSGCISNSGMAGLYGRSILSCLRNTRLMSKKFKRVCSWGRCLT